MSGIGMAGALVVVAADFGLAAGFAAFALSDCAKSGAAQRMTTSKLTADKRIFGFTMFSPEQNVRAVLLWRNGRS
jgi:hypothetical protein